MVIQIVMDDYSDVSDEGVDDGDYEKSHDVDGSIC